MDAEIQDINVNVTLSNKTSECNVNCGDGTKTTTIVSCAGKKSSQAGKFRIDDSLDCTTTFIQTNCTGNGSNCPGIYHLILNKLQYA
jgi:hypothetical protein